MQHQQNQPLQVPELDEPVPQLFGFSSRVEKSKQQKPSSSHTSNASNHKMDPSPKASPSSCFFTLAPLKKRGGGKRKIAIEYIQEKTRRQITFSKRKAGLMKKAYELGVMTGSDVMALIVSESGQVHTFATSRFKNFLERPEARDILRECLASESHSSNLQNVRLAAQETASKTTQASNIPLNLLSNSGAIASASAQTDLESEESGV